MLKIMNEYPDTPERLYLHRVTKKERIIKKWNSNKNSILEKINLIALMVMIGSLMVTDLSVASVSVFGAGAAWFGLFFYANR